jgi:hypothetical protein
MIGVIAGHCIADQEQGCDTTQLEKRQLTTKKNGEACTSNTQCRATSSSRCWYGICQDYWVQRNFTTLGEMDSDWTVTYKAYGQGNLKVVFDPLDRRYTSLSVL